MYYTARIVKEKYPDAKIVFVGPCVAKRKEVKLDPCVDFTLTFEEVGSVLEGLGIKIEEAQPFSVLFNAVREAHGFAQSGGVINAVKVYLKDENVNAVQVANLTKKNVALLRAYAKTGKAPAQLFDEYITRGSFPFIAETGIQGPQARDYLMSLYDTIVIRDVIERLKVSDVPTLRDITKFLLHSIGNRISIKKISDTLSSNGNKTDQETVAKYLKGLTDTLVLYLPPRYNVRGRQLLSTNGKYYAVDLGLRGALVKTQSSDIGHILENVVYLELLRRGYDVYVGDIDGGEIDFVALNSDETAYFQVSATTLDETTLNRELAPFKKVRDNYPKTLLTLDTLFADANYEGVRKRNVIDWLLE